jgi:Na+-translocating ferredoxin:NAD+ oxidoreductase RnfD subunit
MRDPRLYQIATLSALLAYGMSALRFEVAIPQVLVTLGMALGVQLVLGRLWGLTSYDPRSALISGLSLCLLLRTEQLWVAAAAAALAVGSKFVLRWRGKHVFNPTNVALVALLAAGRAWVSPGQWGSSAFFAFLMACLGGLVVNRALRSDVTAAFLAWHLSFLFARTWRLGDPLSIPLHQLQSGALLLFAFFMISDPKTTPDSRAGRILFAALVAAGAYFVQFRLYRPNGLLWSLAACSLAVPLIDVWLPGTRYQWMRPAASALKGASNEACADVRLLGAARVAAGPPRLRLLRLLRGEG